MLRFRLMDTKADSFIRLMRLALCGGIVGAASAGLLKPLEDSAASGAVGAVLGFVIVIGIKLVHVL